MTFSEFTFIADENIDPELINFLRNNSIKIYTLWDFDLGGSPDEEILFFAQKEKRVIITQDRDFGSLIHTLNLDFYAIVYLRPGHFRGEFHIETINAILRSDVQLSPPFIIVAENSLGKVKIRIRDRIRN